MIKSELMKGNLFCNDFAMCMKLQHGILLDFGILKAQNVHVLVWHE